MEFSIISSTSKTNLNLNNDDKSHPACNHYPDTTFSTTATNLNRNPNITLSTNILVCYPLLYFPILKIPLQMPVIKMPQCVWW